MFLLDTITYDKLFETVDMDIGGISCRSGIAAFYSLEYHPVFLRQVFCSSEIILVYVSEAENQLLKLLYHLNKYFVVA